MSGYIVISREELSRRIELAYKEGWKSSCLEWDQSTDLIRLRHADYVRSAAVVVAPNLPTGWRPIADAPKDGTFIIVGVKRERADYPTLAETANWKAGIQEWRTSVGYMPCNGEKPTHFLPLIEPTEK